MEIDLNNMESKIGKPPSINVKKYFHYLLKKKYVISGIAVVFAAIFGIIIPHYIQLYQEYTTSAIIRFDDPRLSRGIAAVTDFSAGMETTSKVSILTTNSFLEQVTDSLKLNFIMKTPQVRRTELFKKIVLAEEPVYGTYTLGRSDDEDHSYVLEFEDFETEKSHILRTFNVESNSVSQFRQNGLTVVFNNSVLKRYDEVAFVVVSKLAAANALRDKGLAYSLDRTRTLLTISYANKDPKFSSFVTNRIADLFIEKLLDLKRFQTKFILESLEEQLKVAEAELTESENALSEFRSQNPRVFMTDARQSVIAGIVNSETRVQTYETQLNQLEQLEQKLSSPQSIDGAHYSYQEAVAFLAARNVPGADIFSETYQQLLTEYQTLINQAYTENHPMVVNIMGQIEELQKEIRTRMGQYKSQLSSELSTEQNNVRAEQRALRSMPGNEIKLAGLMRNRQIKENILSSIMVRYNEAKVTDAATIPDAYIVDYAKKPLTGKKGMTWYLMFWILGGIVGFIIALIALVFYALINNKIWTSKEVEDKLSLNVLAMIPLIRNNNNGEEFINNDTIDPKLITGDYAPTPAGEAFRRLRTLLYLGADDKKSIAISSLYPNEGKSLVSANLAIAFAQQKKKTLLIDGDLRRGVIHSTFARLKTPGLSDILIRKTPADEKHVGKIIQDTHIPNLFLLTCGSPLPNPSEILGSKRMEQLFKDLENKFDRVVIDTPPFGLSPDLFVINSYVRNIALVIMSEKTRLSEFTKALKDFEKIKNDITGIIINGSNEVARRSFYDYSYYSY